MKCQEGVLYQISQENIQSVTEDEVKDACEKEKNIVANAFQRINVRCNGIS